MIEKPKLKNKKANPSSYDLKKNQKPIDYKSTVGGHREHPTPSPIDLLIMVRLQPVVDQLTRMNTTLERMLNLYELELQKISGLTTDTRNVPLSDLADTKVAYNDPELGEMIERLETDAGRPLNSDELERVMKAWNEETGAS